MGEATVGDMKGSKSLQDFSVKMVDEEGFIGVIMT